MTSTNSKNTFPKMPPPTPLSFSKPPKSKNMPRSLTNLWPMPKKNMVSSSSKLKIYYTSTHININTHLCQRKTWFVLIFLFFFLFFFFFYFFFLVCSSSKLKIYYTSTHIHINTHQSLSQICGLCQRKTWFVLIFLFIFFFLVCSSSKLKIYLFFFKIKNILHINTH